MRAREFSLVLSTRLSKIVFNGQTREHGIKQSGVLRGMRDLFDGQLSSDILDEAFTP